MTQFRTEHDSMGNVQVPKNALYQAQTQRAVNNFRFSDLTMPTAFIDALAYIKSSAAVSNAELGLLDSNVASAIVVACNTLLEGNLYTAFPVDVFQTGSGTSSNMNANEVIATLASEHLGKAVSPNDHVNMGQSSNDVIPSAIHISTALVAYNQLLPAVKSLIQTIDKKSNEIGDIVKTGRTHLMDAMPVTFGQVLTGWKQQLVLSVSQINHALEQVLYLAQGGTAVGTGINADPKFATTFCKHLTQSTGLSFKPAASFFAVMGAQDAIVSLSGQLKTLATSLMKIANDLRLMNSGPLTGFAEIELPALQPGSSIMPGKVNPVIPEATSMICAQVIGNDTTITIAGQSGNFELNTMQPVIAYNILQSLVLLANACYALGDKAIAGFKVNVDNISTSLALNPILVTALNPVIGYLKAAEIAKRAYAEKRPIIDVAVEMTDLSRETLSKLLNPKKLTSGGVAN